MRKHRDRAGTDEANHAHRVLRWNFRAAIIFGIAGTIVLRASYKTTEIQLGGGTISVISSRSPGTHFVGLGLVAIATIFVTVAVIGWGVSLGIRSARG